MAYRERMVRMLALMAGLGLLILGWLGAPVWQTYLRPDSRPAEQVAPAPPAPPVESAVPGAASPVAIVPTPVDSPVASEFPALDPPTVPFEFPLLDAAPDTAGPRAPDTGSGETEVAPPAAAEEPVTFAGGGVVSEGLIVLKPQETGNYKLVNLLELTRLVNSASPDGYPLAGGATFSFLRSGLMDGAYVMGRDNRRRPLQAGGICAGSTLIATLVTAAQEQAAPLTLTQRVPHSTYEPPYHQVNLVGGRRVPVVDAAVVELPGVSQDLRWTNADTARYAFRFFLLLEAPDGTRTPVDETAAWAAYTQDPYGPIAAPVYFYGRLVRMP